LSLAPLASIADVDHDSIQHPFDSSHFYVTLQGGYLHSNARLDNSNLPPINIGVSTKTRGNGFAGKLSLGYNINNYIGLSVGALMSTKTAIDSAYTSGPDPYGQSRTNMGYQAYDALINLHLPINLAAWPRDRKVVFTLSGGMAYVNMNYQTNYEGSDNASIRFSPPVNLKDTRAHGVVPTFALGVEYQFSRHFGLGLNDQLFLKRNAEKEFTSYEQQYKNKDLSRYLPQINVISAAVIYHF
jgi:hypothetical protein